MERVIFWRLDAKLLNCPLDSRPAQFWGGFFRQTPSLSLTQNVTLYQFLGPYNIILPRHESFQIGQFILILALKLCTVVHDFNGHEFNGKHGFNGKKCYDGGFLCSK